MKTVHPEFDGKWFVPIGDDFIEAPSLRALTTKLGPAYKLHGYFPNGHTSVLRYRSSPKLVLVKKPKPVVVAPLADVKSISDPKMRQDKLHWNEEQIALLMKLHSDGLSKSQIGFKLGTSRNAIVGKIDRLKKLGLWHE